jgi:hypothetical protein
VMITWDYSGPGDIELFVTFDFCNVLESVVQPSTGPEPHRHSREEEGFYILEGQYEFRVGPGGMEKRYATHTMPISDSAEPVDSF